MDNQRWLIITFCAVIAVYLLIAIGAVTVCAIYAKDLIESPTLICDKRDRIIDMLGLVLATVVALLQGRAPPPGGTKGS